MHFNYRALRSSEHIEDVVQLIHQSRQRRGAVQQVGDGAEQVAEQIARTRLGGDVQNDLAEIYVQPEQVEVERGEDEIEDVTVRRRGRQRDAGSGSTASAVRRTRCCQIER